MFLSNPIKRLKKCLPDSVLTTPEELLCYSFDASSNEGLPAAVVKPMNVQECSKAIAFASESGLSIIPRGAGTGTTGGAVPFDGAVILSLERMNRIIDLDQKNSVVIVEPGVINGHLQKHLQTFGLFYPPDPASMAFCTLGGNVAENAGGPRCIKYGVTRDYVLGLEVVLPDGQVLTTGVKTHKGVVGYDLTRLIVGSEGTLAVISKIFLKVLPMPEKNITLLGLFKDMRSAAEAVISLTSSGIMPATLEFMDKEAVYAVEQYRKNGFPMDCEAILLIEVDGPFPSVEIEAEKAAEICISHGAYIRRAEEPDSRERLWESRRSISPALYCISPHKINEDIVVPRSSLPDILDDLRAISEKYGLKIVNFGHAGDGNIHVNIMLDKNDKEEYAKGKKAVKDIFEATLRLGGTISGEHGIGLTKRPFINMEVPPKGLNLMKKIKEVFDPKGIMNPGKIFP